MPAPARFGALLVALTLLASGCRSDPSSAPEPQPGPKAGPGEPSRPGNLLREPGRNELYHDLDSYSQRYMAARDQGSTGAWESLHRTVLAPLVDKNLPELLSTAASSDEPRLRVIAVRALGFASEKTAAVSTLVGVLSQSDANLVSSALASLYVLGSPDTPLGPLVALLNHDDQDVRSNDALALFAVLRTRRREGRVPPTEEVREASGRLVYIVSNLEEDPIVRGNAAAALGAIGDPAATDILVNLLTDEASVVRTRAAQGLGQLGQEQAILPLIEAMKAAEAPNEAFVIAAAVEKIALTRGFYCDAKALGTDSERWRDWYLAVRR